MPTFLVSHRKGGVGKSTIAINLAAAFAMRHGTTELIDLDESTQTSQVAANARDTAMSLGLISKSTLPPVTSVEIGNMGITEIRLQLSKVFTAARARSQFIVLDAGAGDPAINSFALDFADVLLMPFPCEPGAYASTIEYAARIAEYSAAVRPSLKSYAVLNRYNGTRRAAHRALEEVARDDFPFPMIGLPIPTRTRLGDLSENGQTIFDVAAPGDDDRVAFESIAAGLVEAGHV